MKPKKNKKNKYEQVIDAELDLHGCYQAEAEKRVGEFLEQAKENGYKRVRIITGKGLHSPAGKGVLKELVEEILKYQAYDYREAKLNEGGEGAVIVKLK